MTVISTTAAKVEKATKIMVGRREGELLAFPSVRRMTNILVTRCREDIWVRTAVPTLERFRVMTGNLDLEALLQKALAEPRVAERALFSFASALDGYTAIQVASLSIGPKVWFRLNGVQVPWRPLPGRPAPSQLAIRNQYDANNVVLVALIGSGLCLTELLRLRIGSVGSLDAEGRLIPDFEADPLAVQHTPRRGKQGERITFLTYQAREALLAHIQERASAGRPIDLDAPLLTQRDGAPATLASVAYARRRSQALIQACSEVNVTMCRATGDFFRDWGLPGSHFAGVDELNLEDFI